MSAPRPCQSCGDMVIDLQHRRTRKAAPINVDPVERGNVDIDLDAGEYWIVDPGPWRYVSHYATCPDAAAWRGHPAVERIRRRGEM